ncbi:hypothetical protein KL933_003067 [Ogataea haglerorum]|uniref:Uncharacterized protein n=1 Tax=Ogataea haglerorum TaxID=1937702 RepID=A0AAN6I0G3_9ASCO|nr:uncharacterized protein KL911_000629 [Ogataea haglerorum]KAG7693490.1 hypothetical protein KL951_004511 [Ogataea haglerorum]KAG7713612.1 hypothetical protein KL913_004952 [Ogataea haglerorum]KAG7714092.1 hypothetical protein KL949_004947 [Ogataea haglerorum]KAG7725657.1 hypothetical protein KL948_004841 [Ogataea haglerorum]KAG7726784.1 hypothetical protein KL933_003067 [Ogataea haglerorum]
MGSLKDNLDLLGLIYKRFLQSRNVHPIAIGRSDSHISVIASEGKSILTYSNDIYTIENHRKDTDGTEIKYTASLKWPQDANVKYPAEINDIDSHLVDRLFAIVRDKFGRFFPMESKPATQSDAHNERHISQLRESVVGVPEDTSSQATQEYTPTPSYTSPAPKPLPASLAPPSFEDEHQIQSSRTDPLPSGDAQAGVNDLYPGGMKDPPFKPYLDPLAVNPTRGGGMHPTSSDSLFNRNLEGSRSGIRYDDPLLGPDEDPELLGAGLPGQMGLPGQGGFRRPPGAPGPPGSFGSSGGFGGLGRFI